MNWPGRNWNVHTLKSKTTKGKENFQWNENISTILVVNKQRKHSRSVGLPGCCPWPLIGKVFKDIGKRMATIMNLTPCRVCSEVNRGFFPEAGPLSLSFHHLKGNWWHQSSTAVNINKFSCWTQASLNIFKDHQIYSGYQSHAPSNDFFLFRKLRFGGRQSNVSMTIVVFISCQFHGDVRTSLDQV